MKGSTLAEFTMISARWGAEKVFAIRNKRYFLETIYHEETGLDEMYIIEVSDTNPIIARFFGKDFDE